MDTYMQRVLWSILGGLLWLALLGGVYMGLRALGVITFDASTQ